MAIFDLIFDFEDRRWGLFHQGPDGHLRPNLRLRRSQMGELFRSSGSKNKDRGLFEDGGSSKRREGSSKNPSIFEEHLLSSKNFSSPKDSLLSFFGPENRKKNTIYDLRSRGSKKRPSSNFDYRPRRSKNPPIFDLRPRRMDRRSAERPRGATSSKIQHYSRIDRGVLRSSASEERRTSHFPQSWPERRDEPSHHLISRPKDRRTLFTFFFFRFPARRPVATSFSQPL